MNKEAGKGEEPRFLRSRKCSVRSQFLYYFLKKKIYLFIWICSTLAWKIPWMEEPGRLQWGSDTTERLHFHFSLSCIGEGNGNPLQCSCLENPRDRGAWWAAIYEVAQSRTWLKWLIIKDAGSSVFIAACGIQFSGQGWNPGPLHWERRVLTTGPPEKSSLSVTLNSSLFSVVQNLIKCVFSLSTDEGTRPRPVDSAMNVTELIRGRIRLQTWSWLSSGLHIGHFLMGLG